MAFILYFFQSLSKPYISLQGSDCWTMVLSDFLVCCCFFGGGTEKLKRVFSNLVFYYPTVSISLALSKATLLTLSIIDFKIPLQHAVFFCIFRRTKNKYLILISFRQFLLILFPFKCLLNAYNCKPQPDNLIYYFNLPRVWSI